MGERVTTPQPVSAGGLLDLIRSGRANTRAALQRATGLSRSTVGQRLDLLNRAGWLRHTTGASTGGRPSERIVFDPTHASVVAVDLETRHARAAVLDLTGTIGGDVSVDVERIELGNGAEIAGSLSYVAPSAVRIREGARISGPIDRDSIAPWGVGSDIRARFFSPLVRTVWMLMTGAIIIALAPRLASALNDTLRRPALVGIVGLVAIPLVPGIAVLLIASVVGIPLSMLILTTYLMALYLSQFVVGQRIGSLILPDRWNDGSRGYLLLSMTIGVLLLSVLRFVPIPFLGTLVNVLVAVLGLGAAVMLIRELRPDRSGRVA